MKETQITNPSKKRLKNEQKYKDISDSQNGPKEAKKCCPFSAAQGSLEKGHPPRPCRGPPRECCIVLDCDEILFYREVILDLSSVEASLSPTNDGLDEMNEAILLALSDEPFSFVWQILGRICPPKGTV
jgi:hypothetical protein